MSVIGSSDLIGRAPGGRKLIAVVYADMVGYSRLIGLDDIGTLERIRILRGTLINPAIDGNCSPGVIASVPAWYQPVAVLVSQSASEFS
jgi:hypothetical protein